MGFELPRREIDDQPPYSTVPTSFEAGCDQLEMGRANQSGLWVYLVKCPFYKAKEVAPQDHRVLGRH